MIKKLFFLLRLLIAGLASVLLLATFVTSVDAASVPSWVKNNLAQWVVEDKIDLADLIIAIEYLINVE